MTLAAALRAVLLDAASHPQQQADEQVPAAVLVALYESGDGGLRVVLTKRRADLRRHAGEISFPGGRRDPEDATLRDTALREAEEEIGLTRSEVTVVGALECTSTFVTNYAIHPFVGLLKGSHPWRTSELEVDAVLEPTAARRSRRKDAHAHRTARDLIRDRCLRIRRAARVGRYSAHP